MEQQTMPVVEGLAYLQTFVKAKSIYENCGRTAVWFSQRYKQGQYIGGTYSFNEEDVKLLNNALVKIAARLDHFFVKDGCSKEIFLEDFREVLSVVKKDYLRTEVLKCNLNYWSNRTCMQKRTDGCYRFSSEEIEKINSAVKHIAEILTSTTLTI